MNNDNMSTPLYSEVDIPPESHKTSNKKIKLSPYSEIDIPPKDSNTVSHKKMSPKDIGEYEKMQEIDLKDFMAKNGLRLLVCILITMTLLVIVDTIIINQEWKASEHLSTVIDFGKYIATTLLGFLFANKSERDSTK